MYHHAVHHLYRRSRPSRLLWFALGSGTTYWYLSRHDIRNSSHWGHCFRAPVQAPPSLQSQAYNSTSSSSDANAYGPREKLLLAQQRLDKEWEEDKMRMMALSHRAGETVREPEDGYQVPCGHRVTKILSQVADLSEATLDSILATVEGLKTVGFLSNFDLLIS